MRTNRAAPLIGGAALFHSGPVSPPSAAWQGGRPSLASGASQDRQRAVTESGLATSPAAAASPLRPWYLAAAVAALAVMIAAILGDNRWFLDFVHVMAGALWTGID